MTLEQRHKINDLCHQGWVVSTACPQPHNELRIELVSQRCDRFGNQRESTLVLSATGTVLGRD